MLVPLPLCACPFARAPSHRPLRTPHSPFTQSPPLCLSSLSVFSLSSVLLALSLIVRLFVPVLVEVAQVRSPPAP